MPLNDELLRKERNYYVVKANELITKSRYSLSLQQQKILLYLISRIKPDDDINTVYELSIKDFAKICGYDTSTGYYYPLIKDDIKKLRDTSSWIEIEKGREVLFSWLNTAEINKNSGKIQITFHSTVSPYLFQLRERYTQYNLYQILCLSHKYSIRLYEYLLSMKYKEIIEVDIDTLKKRIDAEKYEKISHFKDRVFIPAINEINDYTNLNIEYKFKKTGRTISHIVFRFIEETGASYAISEIFRNTKLDPQRRKEEKNREKELEERRKKRRAAIEAEGIITAQMTLEELITNLEKLK